MCVVVESRCILANILAYTDVATPNALANCAAQLRAKAPYAYVDISDEGVLCAVENDAELFSLSKGGVVRARNAQPLLKRDFLNRTVNAPLSNELKKALEEICDSL